MSQPFDDYHRFARPAAMIGHLVSAFTPFGGAANPTSIQDLLAWLSPDASSQEMTDADMTTMRAFGYTRKGG